MDFANLAINAALGRVTVSAALMGYALDCVERPIGFAAPIMDRSPAPRAAATGIKVIDARTTRTRFWRPLRRETSSLKNISFKYLIAHIKKSRPRLGGCQGNVVYCCLMAMAYTTVVAARR